MPDFNTLDDLLAHHLKGVKNAKGEPFILRWDQKEDVENLYVFDRVGLFNEVGTGKSATGTVMVLAWDAAHAVVLMPPILLTQWRRWLESLHDAGNVIIYSSEIPPNKRKTLDLSHFRWILMTPQIFKRDYAKIAKELGLKKEVALLVDEAQSVKNTETATHKKVNEFALGRKLVLMTGTPISSPADSFGYVRLKTPGVYRSFTNFENLHVGARDFFGTVTEWRDLDKMKANFMLQATRRLSREVLDIKEPNYIPRVYTLDPEHMELYNTLMEEQLLLLPNGGKIDATAAQRLFNAAQQIVCNWDYYSGDPTCRSKAFDLIESIADEIDLMNPKSSKLIVYTWFVMTNRAMMREFEEKFHAVAAYSEIPQARQRANIDRFLNDPSCRLLFAQPLSGGAGWNPQHVCWETLFIEEPTYPFPFIQGVGRTVRDGQEHVPNIRLATAEGTIQLRLHQRLLDKDALANKVQGGYEDLRDAIHGKR